MTFSQSGSGHHQYHHGVALVPHRGSLCRIEGQSEILYVLEILLDEQSSMTHELVFLRKDFDFALRLFSIMDTESRGQISKSTVQEFVTLRCPVFWRRDEDLEPSVSVSGTSPTFEEVWLSVAACSLSARLTHSNEDDLVGHAPGANSTNNCGLSSVVPLVELGVEGWMVFCRFIALAQYLEAKRRFSGRHLQQTMRHRNGPRGSELVVVDVPPPAPPVRLTASELAIYEQENRKCLPLPELDLDHSLLTAHDVLRRRRRRKCSRVEDNTVGLVKVELFGSSTIPSSSASSSHASLEFCLTYVWSRDEEDGITTDALSVRRSMSDMKWLNDTFISHKALGGTLCGRILPPFPGNRVSAAAQMDDSTLGSTGGAIGAATNAGVEFANAGVGIATAGVGILKQGIKSFWGGYISTSQQSDQEKKPSSKQLSVSSAKNMANMQTYYNPNSPAGKARHLERYINYLLEHPALSTSFPLNTILKASQSGLEAAKQSIEEHTRAAREIKDQTPQMDDGKLVTFWSVHGSNAMQPNLAWVRTAAQAAVALKLHGVLETTGLQSASARLQHASLPTFNNSRNSTWADDEGEKFSRNDSEDSEESRLEESFEEGVMHVQDELESDSFFDHDDDGGYDLLPLPVPAPERQILNVSEAKRKESSKKETRFRYGSPHLQDGVAVESPDDEKRVFLGEMAIDENIDKLREVIGSVDNILSRCTASSGGIERSRRRRLSLHLDILRGLDSWEGLRGKFVSQRALLKGVSGIEQSKEVFEESDLALIDDISWQTALAHSAVSAAEDVRSTVRAARTASNAKAAATSAAKVAQAACDKGTFSNIDEARGAQTRASIAQSHAIHAAVVEHEAKTVKRRATLALAHDVKCWNAHRKREILQICLAHAKSQHEATRRAVDAWSCLRDGFVGSTIIPPSQTRRTFHTCRKPNIDLLSEEMEATIYGDADDNVSGQRKIVAVEHDLLKIPGSTHMAPTHLYMVSISAPVESEAYFPLVEASPVPDEDNDIGDRVAQEAFAISSHFRSSGSVHAHSVTSSPEQQKSRVVAENDENEIMTSSMQSLVDGLMNWGGVDVEEDFALPTGMAASIALEESGAFGKAKIV